MGLFGARALQVCRPYVCRLDTLSFTFPQAGPGILGCEQKVTCFSPAKTHSVSDCVIHYREALYRVALSRWLQRTGFLTAQR